ncbi:Type II secretory pathway component GspD/PulD (secretin) [Prosthecobacter debontii]|uniref:Type II secretory pathway component GspD/PulD (Secretin) n=1 Tax=Prosthecobacter debontii TaxID=48467 RepID=A0A1T4XRA5_9BACT|nr:hypothetical protein [Prosthecobacter debontii]SKA92082.1 Type II secretory pathway component GspD/PulD (secretin) [Prosthecobacter debontii]
MHTSRLTLLVLFIGASLAFPLRQARAQLGGSPFNFSSSLYEAEASKLRDAPPQQYDFSNAILSDVLRFLATDAGISFFSLPNDSPEGSRQITFSIRSSPFRVLETLCKANELAIIPDNGIWYIRPADDKELIGKSYQIRYNSLEKVDRVSSGSGLGLTPVGGSGGSSGGGGVNLQGNQETFSVRRSEIINAIRDLLSLPKEESETGGQGGDVAAAAAALGGVGGDQTKALNSNELSAYRKPKVIWMSDSNTLYVVATRLQHLWVEGYLEAADKPQTLIAIEVKFIETTRDPKREFGIDWTGTFDTGNFRAVDSVTTETDSTTGQEKVIVEYNNTATNGGYRADLTNLLTGANLNAAGGGLAWPALGILSSQDINVKLRAMLRDEETQMTSYPRMVTLNNSEVSFRSVVNQPVLDGTASATVGAGATTTSSIAYLPIGTVLNILPKRMNDDKILLNMAVTVSSIISTEVINGNPYPVASSRIYNAPVEVNSGYTVAVGGLDEAREREGKAGVPFLHSIPLLGKAFKYDSKSKNHKNLMLFITPQIIDARDGGLPPEPQSVIPQKPNQFQPKIPQVDQNSGALLGGPKSLPNAVAYLTRETDILHHTIHEGRITPDESRKLKELKIAVEQLDGQCEVLKQQYPNDYATIYEHQQKLKGLLDRNQQMARLLFSKKYF